MNEIDVIKGARDILASGQWRKGSLDDGAGNMCIVGAIKEIGYRSASLREAAEHAVAAHLPDNALKTRAELVLYNDDPATTLQDMLDLIDKTLADMGAL